MPQDPLEGVRLRRTLDYLIAEHRSNFSLDPTLMFANILIGTMYNAIT